MDWLDGFLDDAWDSATGVYDKYLDFESKKYELDTLKELNFVNNANASGTGTDTGSSSNSGFLGNIKKEYVAFALLGLVVLFVLKK